MGTACRVEGALGSWRIESDEFSRADRPGHEIAAAVLADPCSSQRHKLSRTCTRTCRSWRPVILAEGPGRNIRSLWVPIIRSWALTRGFALHPGTRNRYEIRDTRTQHRPPSRQVNDHGRVSGTHRRSTASWWRNTMISRSFERPDRTVSRASDANNRYKIRCTRIQHRPASRQVNEPRPSFRHPLAQAATERAEIIRRQAWHLYIVVSTIVVASISIWIALLTRPGAS